MKNAFLILIVVTLASCSGSTLPYSGIEPVEVALDGSTFHVYRKGEDVEVVRTGASGIWSLQQVAGLTAQAVYLTTNCRIAEGTLSGDAAVQHARLNC
ncbi:hypothetical protein [Marivivens aquimaris]|uniref:hypothetical protein n=1 Tax=Marivivens aquimaris TaxID=2774876 RepID=UPI001881A7C3|nr:hypothetical protein [Marivivens aquimaris]